MPLEELLEHLFELSEEPLIPHAADLAAVEPSTVAGQARLNLNIERFRAAHRQQLIAATRTFQRVLLIGRSLVVRFGVAKKAFERTGVLENDALHFGEVEPDTSAGIALVKENLVDFYFTEGLFAAGADHDSGSLTFERNPCMVSAVDGRVKGKSNGEVGTMNDEVWLDA